MSMFKAESIDESIKKYQDKCLTDIKLIVDKLSSIEEKIKNIDLNSLTDAAKIKLWKKYSDLSNILDSIKFELK